MNRSTAVLCLTLTALTALATATVTGCGSGGHATPRDPVVSSPASSVSSSASTSGDAGSASLPSTGATPSVMAASGPVIDGVQVSFHVPPGWKQTPGEVRWEHRFGDDTLGASGELTEQLWPSDSAEATPAALDQMVAATKDAASADTHWRRLPDVTVAGLPFYHLVATGGGEVEEQYGSLLRHHEVVFDLTWLTDSSTASQRRTLTAQILASVAVK